MQLLGVNPPVGFEPRLRVEPDDIDNQRVVLLEVATAIAVPSQGDVARVRRIEVNAREAAFVHAPDLIELVPCRFDETKSAAARCRPRAKHAIELARLSRILSVSLGGLLLDIRARPEE